MSKMGWFEVVMVIGGHWKLHKSMEHIQVCLLAFHSNYVFILHCFWDKPIAYRKILVENCRL